MGRITKIDEIKPISSAKRVAAYCRVSTDQESQLLSLETQKAHYETLIMSTPGWELAGIYFDEGISGTKKVTRPALIHMMDDCERGVIDLIITKSISRFARNTTDTLELVRKLQMWNIPVIFEKENINTGDMEGELLLTIMSSLAENESVSMSENIKWGIRKRFETGTFKCSVPPYGYYWNPETAQLLIDEEQAAVVRSIFDDVLSGASSQDIAKSLTERDIPTQRGGKWTPHMVRLIIKNEKYTGCCLFQKTYKDELYIQRRNMGEKDQFFMEDHHEAIVSMDVFEKANAMIDRRAEERGMRTGSDKYKNRYPFSGKAFCGKCGAKMKRVSTPNMVQLGCCNHMSGKDRCPMPRVPYDGAETAFVTVMNKLIYGKNQVFRPFYKALSAVNNSNQLLEINDIMEEMEKVTDKKLIIHSFFSNDLISMAVLQSELNKLNAEESELKARKDMISYQASSRVQNREEAEKLLKFLSRSEMFEAFDENAFSQFVESITVLDEHTINFKMKCGLNLTERIE